VTLSLDIVASFTPTGKLRAAINLGNPSGMSIDLAQSPPRWSATAFGGPRSRPATRASAWQIECRLSGSNPKDRLWPGRAKADFKLVAVNQSSKAGQQVTF